MKQMRTVGFLLLVSLAWMACAQAVPMVANQNSGAPASIPSNGKAMAQMAAEIRRHHFYENIGQIDSSELMFYGRMQGGFIGFAENRVLLWTSCVENNVTLTFEGAKDAAPRGVGPAAYHTNYFLTGRGLFTSIRGFTQVVYDSLWPGISLVYRIEKHGMKCEFRMAPGADPDSIEIRCDGYDVLDIESRLVGDCIEGGMFLDSNVKAFQNSMEVGMMFISKGPSTFGFEFGDFDRSQELVVDSFLYSTYVGGSSFDVGTSIAVDSTGSIYVTGLTGSSDFPMVNANDSLLIGLTDCFVFKLNATGDGLIYSTFVGGSGMDWALAIAIDSEGNAYITGRTCSTDLATFNAYDSSYNGGDDCFLLKLNATGNGLVYSTYIGGSDWDLGESVIVDSTGNVYVTGSTESLDFPTANPFDGSHNGNKDCFVFKLNAFGDGLIYSTFVGGSEMDWAYAIAIDSEGSAYVTGSTRSSDFPTVSSYDNSYNGEDDCFLLKLNAAGNELFYSTYIGGSSSDDGESIIVDSEGSAYVTGSTRSSDFPTMSAYDNSYNGAGDCFVLKLNVTGSELFYSTYIGGSSSDYAQSIAIDSEGNAYVTGDTGSSDFPIVSPLGGVYNGGEGDCFVFRINATGDSLRYSNYFGGSSEDGGTSIVMDSMGNVYVTGYTESSDFPTMNAYDSSYNGGIADCFVFKLPFQDSDGDGLLDLEEIQLGTDRYDNDTDSDGMPDGWEIRYMLNATGNDAGDDPDSDGLSNLEEYHHGTSPRDNDTDSDGMPDGWEVANALDPLNDDAQGDVDSDGLSNLQEYEHETDPCDNDTDGDGMADGWEVQFGLNPLVVDADGDCDTDGLSNIDEYQRGTDPCNFDSDGDGIGDEWEVAHGYDPLDPWLPLDEILIYNLPLIGLASALAVSVVILYSIGHRLEESRQKERIKEDAERTRRVLSELASTSHELDSGEKEHGTGMEKTRSES